ncbi:MAG: YkgJ family cysteine cluster protein [Nitrospirae bacterium]|jgi:uncharacterized protein|nr:YkgJ family cysteine cluster protein [Nitrospirota bacterium]
MDSMFFVPIGEEVPEDEEKGSKKDITQTLLKPESRFKFYCHKGLSCFNKCCMDTTMLLTPYDIIRMKNALKIPSEEFLAKYTTTLIKEDGGFPAIVLKMRDDENKSCPFVTQEGCSIYQDRPWSCRSYPLQPQSSKDTDRLGKEFYSIMKWPFCLGFDEDKEWTVEEWKEDQGLNNYNEVDALFKEITLDENLTKEEILNEDIQKMFHMVCYDIDRFKEFVFESKFLKIFDVEQEIIEKIKKDDVELLKLGFKWLKFGLIDRNALKIRAEILEAKKK